MEYHTANGEWPIEHTIPQTDLTEVVLGGGCWVCECLFVRSVHMRQTGRWKERSEWGHSGWGAS